MRTGMIKVLELIHKREKQKNPRLAWFMFHNIYRMYSDTKNKEEKMHLRYSQACNSTKKPINKMKNSTTHVITMIKINLS